MSHSKFRSSTNLLYLKGLFYETTNADKTSVQYTLKDWDHKVGDVVYPSLYLAYMRTNDPTEYRFAVEYLESWDHWERLCACTWFKEYVERWRRELDLRMKSQSLARIMAEGKGAGREAFAANKYLLEKGWEPKEASKRGRPSREAIKEAADRHFSIEQQVSADFERIQLKN